MAAPTFGTLRPKVTVGALERKLPRDVAAVETFADAFYDVFWEIDPAKLDRAPTVTTTLGTIPVPPNEREEYLLKLDDSRRTSTGLEALDGTMRMAAADVLGKHLDALWRRWDALVDRLQAVLYRVELRAVQLATGFLLEQRATALTELRRYNPEEHFLVSAAEPNRVALQELAQRLVAARKAHQVDSNIRKQFVADVLGTGFTAAVVLGALQSGQFTGVAPWRQDVVFDFDPEVWKQLAWAEKKRAEVTAAAAKAVISYAQQLTTAAAQHPLCLIADLERLARSSRNQMIQALEAAVEKNGVAVRRLISNIQQQAVIGIPAGERVPSEVSVSGFVQRLSAAPSTSIWKMPFFPWRAIAELPPAEARMATGALVLAAGLDSSQAIERGLALDGVDAAMGLAPLAGPVGVAVALGWTLRSLLEAIDRYEQLKSLVNASLDHRLLLADPVRDQPSATPIVFAVLGLWVK